MSFADLGLTPALLRAVADKGYDVPTPIQIKAIPAVLAGRDVLAGAQTGTGKTAGFVLPILQMLEGTTARNPRALILAPTRELAAQVAESARTYGVHSQLKTFAVFGGVSIGPQISTLRRGCDILVATPGRLLDLAEQRAVDLREVQILVLDEADRMLDMGFINDIRRVIKMLPQQRQNLMFSATYSEDIRQLAGRILRNPLAIDVAARNAPIESVEQYAYAVAKDHKRHLLVHLIKEENWHQVLIFTRTKHGANRLTQQLERAGIEASAIHGNKSQAARVRALQDFKSLKVTALVATEVASRGLDIKELPQVVNYELPNVPEDYVHRIGRTGRAGSLGKAISLVSPDERDYLRDIERLLRRSIPVSKTPEFVVAQDAPLPAGSNRSEHASSPGGQRPRRHAPNSRGRNPHEQRSHSHGRRSHESRSGDSGARRPHERSADPSAHRTYEPRAADPNARRPQEQRPADSGAHRPQEQRSADPSGRRPYGQRSRNSQGYRPGSANGSSSGNGDGQRSRSDQPHNHYHSSGSAAASAGASSGNGAVGQRSSPPAFRQPTRSFGPRRGRA